LAGLQIATIVCANEEIRSKIDRAINDNEVCDVNPFGVIATQAAYNKGEDWLQELITYLHENYLFMVEYCKEYLPEFPVAKLEGTYLAWMDCRALNLSSEVLEERLLKECKLWLNAGSMYGAEGEGFMRWNLACPRSRLTEALERFRGFIGTITRP
jgi:cystathionine beta-lyase